MSPYNLIAQFSTFIHNFLFANENKLTELLIRGKKMSNENLFQIEEKKQIFKSIFIFV